MRPIAVCWAVVELTVPFTVLQACYRSAMTLVKANGIRSVAFPAISCGVYGYPHKAAVQIACTTVVQFICQNDAEMSLDQVVFCCVDEAMALLYKQRMASLRGVSRSTDSLGGH